MMESQPNEPDPSLTGSLDLAKNKAKMRPRFLADSFQCEGDK